MRDDAAATGSRSTAIVGFSLSDRAPNDAWALDTERQYRTWVRIDGREVTSYGFRSPLGDERWRDVVMAMRSATRDPKPGRTPANLLFDAGLRLAESLAEVSPELAAFLDGPDRPRRLVIASKRAEIHRLPWEALISRAKRHLAQADVSIVHADPDMFEPMPWSAPDKMRILALLGPDTPGSTVAGLVPADSQGARGGHVARPIWPASRESLKAALDEVAPDILHVEAHGDNESATIYLAPGVVLEPGSLAALLGPRALVLFWTCYSGLLQSWGDSPGRSLLEGGSRLVVGFSTEVRKECAAEMAARFYRQVLDPREGGDPETALTRERASQYSEQRSSCLWAALTLWLRQPVDLSPMVRKGPRLPEASWTVESEVDLAPLAKALEEVGEGHYLVASIPVPETAPRSLVDRYPGAVVRLHGSLDPWNAAVARAETSLRDVWQAVCGAKETFHPGDAILELLGALATYKRSLVLWSGAGRTEETFFAHLDGVPANVSVVLTTSGDDRELSATPAPSLAALEGLVEQGRFSEADEMRRALERPSPGGDVEAWKRLIAYDAAGFWIAVKLWRNEEAHRCLEDLREAETRAGPTQPLVRFERCMLHGNLTSREGSPGDAYEIYSQAHQVAEGLGSPSALGRALGEMAYVRAELGDPIGAEQLYRRALATLEDACGVGGRWSRNSLARARRDLADLLVQERRRLEEARHLLRQALAGHALDGRYDQLSAVLRTRGCLHTAEGKWDLAERSLEASASITMATGNTVGWSGTMRELARLSLQRGRRDQCLALLTGLADCLRGRGPGFPLEAGLVSLQLARAHWEHGRPDRALEACREAIRQLPVTRIREHTEAKTLERILSPLVDAAAQPGSGSRDRT